MLIPTSNACLSIGNAWASGSVHPIAGVGLPNDIAPRITLETFRPDFPSLSKKGSISHALHILARHTEHIPFWNEIGCFDDRITRCSKEK